MAFKTGPNLESARRQIEKLMDDTCVVVRDRLGARDELLDRTTGVMAPRTITLVYNENSIGTNLNNLGQRAHLGKCKVSSLRDSQPRQEQVGSSGVEIDARFYRFGIPVDTQQLAIGDRVFITSTRRSFHLLGAEFRISQEKLTTFAVQQGAIVERITPIIGAPYRPPIPSVIPDLEPPEGGFVVLASTNLPANRLVRVDTNNQAVLFDQTDPTYYSEAVGITAEPALAGQPVAIISRGPLLIPGSNRIPGKAYFANGANGEISDVVPTTGVFLPVGVAPSGPQANTNMLMVNIGEAYLITV